MPPKSLDRDDFDLMLDLVRELSDADAAATGLWCSGPSGADAPGASAGVARWAAWSPWTRLRSLRQRSRPAFIVMASA